MNNKYFISGGIPPLNFHEILYSQTAENKSFEQKPKAVILPQASCESKRFVNKFYSDYKKIGFKPTSVLFKNDEMSYDTIKEKLLSATLLYINGGNVKTLLSAWNSLHIDDIIFSLDDKIFACVSAGASALFQYAVSDCDKEITGKYTLVKGLGMIKGIFCPHSEDEDRMNFVKKGDLIFPDNEGEIYFSNSMPLLLSDFDNDFSLFIKR